MIADGYWSRSHTHDSWIFEGHRLEEYWGDRKRSSDRYYSWIFEPHRWCDWNWSSDRYFDSRGVLIGSFNQIDNIRHFDCELWNVFAIGRTDN